MSDDAELLGEYAKNGSEQAFSELVRRHVDLVYGAALRRTGDSHRASEVTQKVFTHLARQAGRLTTHTSLAAWLHTVSRNAAIGLMISEKRRRLHESEAATFARIHAPDGENPDWDRVSPVLDAAIDGLPEPDRVAIVLRFLKRQSFAAVGAALRVSEDAARMRTDRALDKLRTRLARQGISSTAAAMGALVSSQTGLSAPAGLAASATSTALAAAAAKTGMGFFLMTTIQKTLITTVALGVLGTLGYEGNVIRLQQLKIEELTTALTRERSSRRTGPVPSATAAGLSLAANGPTGSTALAGKDGAASTMASRANQLQDLIRLNPQFSIPEIALLEDKDWTEIAEASSFDTDEGRRRAFKALRDAAKDKLAPRLIAAIRGFSANSGGQLPADPSQLMQYLAADLPPGVLQRYQMVSPNRRFGERPELDILTETFPVDAEFDTKLELNSGEYILKTTHPAGPAIVQAYNRWQGQTPPPKGPPSGQALAPFLLEPVDPALIDELLPNILGKGGTIKRFAPSMAGKSGP